MQTHRIALQFAGTHAGFAHAFDDLRAALEGDALHPRTRFDVELVFEEIVANIVRHGGAGTTVAVELDVVGGDVVMTIDDDGAPFDPTGRPDPTLPKSLDDAPIGGLGLMMVRRAATEMRYDRTAEEKNRLTIRIPAHARD